MYALYAEWKDGNFNGNSWKLRMLSFCRARALSIQGKILLHGRPHDDVDDDNDVDAAISPASLS